MRRARGHSVGLGDGRRQPMDPTGLARSPPAQDIAMCGGRQTGGAAAAPPPPPPTAPPLAKH